MSRILTIGNKNVSSWSMRAWLALREKGVSFEERTIDLADEGRHALLATLAPPARVPVLHDGGVVVFDSLAIMEYADEAFEGPALLPRDPASRGRARSLLAWMHAGFQALRSSIPFEDTFLGRRAPQLDEAGRAEAVRAVTAFDEALAQSGGPYLFGPLSLADLAFVPLVRRLRAVHFSFDDAPRTGRWAHELWSRPSVQEWMRAAEAAPPYRR